LEAIKQNNSTYFVHEDSLGSVAAITTSNGSLVERYSYDVFGVPTVTYANGNAVDPTLSSLGQPYSFQGREWDSEIGLYYYRARYYDPSLGRFISQDPEGYTDSPNLYQAFLNDSVNVMDPMGTDDQQELDEMRRTYLSKVKQARSDGNISLEE